MDEASVPAPENLSSVVTDLPHDGIEPVAYNHRNEGFGADITVKIGDYNVLIHETANLIMKFATYLDVPVQSQGMAQTKETNAQLYGPDLEATNLDRLAPILNHTHFNLYKKIVSIAQQRIAQRDAICLAREKSGEYSEEFEMASAGAQKTLEEANLEAYYFSKAYDALADIAEKLNLSADLKSLCT